MGTGPDPSRPDLETSVSRNRNYERSRLRQMSSNDIPGTEKALVNAIIESYLQGVSTRNVENVISHLGVNQISASYVSKVARELDVKVTEFMERAIDSHIPYLYVDVSYFKVRAAFLRIMTPIFVILGKEGHPATFQAPLYQNSFRHLQVPRDGSFCTVTPHKSSSAAAKVI